MLFPMTITEQLMYNSVRITTKTGSGTGFFFQYKIEGNSYPILITNKHVVNNNPNEQVAIKVHIGSHQQKTVDDESILVTLNLEWIFHSDHDLCFCFAAPIINYVNKKYNKNMFYIAIDEEMIPNQNKLEDLSAVESVLMVGYPLGLWDEKHNLPLFRKGITSTHPAYDFNIKGIGVADMACFPGSSGSPIFIVDENGYSDKKGNTYLGAKRMMFLGILFEGPQMSITGEVSVVKTVTPKLVSKTTSLINLGYYIKSIEMNEFKTYIQNKIKHQTPPQADKK